ncbi:MAG: amidohydrolase, partial [Gammaproteobacteria bacterium]
MCKVLKYFKRSLISITVFIFLNSAVLNAEPLPLMKSRNIQFETNEATWLSLDVSPNGQTIVMDILGDIYQLPIIGGKAVRITSGMAFDSQPVFSPDGRKIAFISDRNGGDGLWIMNVDGSKALEVSKNAMGFYATPEWSPDGKSILVSRGAPTFEIWRYSLNGKPVERLTKSVNNDDLGADSAHNAIGPVLSADGVELYYARKFGFVDMDARFPLWDIMKKDLRSGTESTFIKIQGSAFSPVISPNGTMMAYGTRHENDTALRLRNLVTGEDRWLFYPVERDVQEGLPSSGLLPGFTFLPNNKEILVSQNGKIQRVDIATAKAIEIPFVAKVDIDLGPLVRTQNKVEEGPVRARLIMQPRLSPDGSQMAFSAFGHVYTMSFPDGKPRRLTKEKTYEYQPSWSPDGKWLTYVTWSRGEGHLWKAQASGRGKPQQLSQYSNFYSEPIWSPDGKNIIMLRGNGYEHTLGFKNYKVQYQKHGVDIISIPAKGGDFTFVTPANGRNLPHFSNDKNRLYLSGKGKLSS